VVDWLAYYGIEARESDRPSELGVPATLTVIRRNLRTDARSYCVVPIEPAAAGEAQKDAIVECMVGYFPEVRWRDYDARRQIATFLGRKHVYLAIYEEHDVPGSRAASDAA
jgi:hypothetical protein